jgi:uncharacterized membrane protein
MNYLKRQYHYDPRYRLSISIGIALLVALLLPHSWRLPLRGIICWDVGAIVFMGLAVVMMIQSDHRIMRRRAEINNESRWRILLGGTLGSSVSLLTIVYMLKDAKNLGPQLLTLHVGLATLTVVCSWLLVHTMFALHYAHDYYVALILHPDAPASLAFPTEDNPDYWDFMYFSFVLGMTAQVADVDINSRKFRKLCTLHGILAFYFNTAIVAMSINLIAGLV